MERQVSAIVVGAGCRGRNYAVFALDFPKRLKIVGVADPRKVRRDLFQKDHNLPQKYIFEDWKEALVHDKFADCVFICTTDQLHKEPAVAFANKGYHVLLEKPMAVTQADCEEIVATCKKNNVMLAVCHVLRYTPEAQTIKEIIDSGAIGDVANIQLLEPVGNWHFAHSYVRGNWRNTETSTFSLLAKSCHDIDLLAYWKGASKCKSVSSFGSLKHFTKQNKPAGAASRCLDCAVEKSCPYSAKRIYLDAVKMGHKRWPVSVITDVVDIENVTDALKTGPYGRCVYECDNNVCDNQVVNLQFEDGSTASFSMVAFTRKICERQVNVFGTKGELKCDFGTMKVIQYDFATEDFFIHDLTKKTEKGKDSRLTGHGGADFFAMDAFVTAVATNDPSKIKTGAEQSLASHILCFKAEESRLKNNVVQLDGEAV